MTDATPYAILCKTPTCGKVYLTEQEYLAQMSQPNLRWCCPVCDKVAEWDDETFEAYMQELDNTLDIPEEELKNGIPHSI